MRILIITQYFPPEIGAAAERMASLTRFLSERAQVAVLAPVPSYPWGTIQRTSQSPGNRFDINGVKVIRVYKYPHRKYFPLRVLGELQYALLSLVYAWRHPKPDLVIITSPSFFLGFIGLALKRLKKIDYVFDVRDHYPDSVLDAGILRNSPLYYILKRMEQAFYSHARLVSVVHRAWRPEIEAWGKKVVVVPNGVDFQMFRDEQERLPWQISPKKIEILESHFIVLFVGNLGTFYDFTPFLSAARELLLCGCDDVQFIFLGEGQQKTDLIRRSKEGDVHNCHFWDPVPNEVLPAILHRSEIGIVGVHPHASSIRGCIPNKVYEYLAGDLDVIACLQGDLPRHLIESGKFFIFQNSDVEGIVKKILDIKAAGKKSETSKELLEKISRRKHFEHLWDAIQNRETES